jgi:hypothetical protein
MALTKMYQQKLLKCSVNMPLNPIANNHVGPGALGFGASVKKKKSMRHLGRNSRESRRNA